MNKTYLSHSLTRTMAKYVERLIHSEHEGHARIFGIPRGGVPVAYLIAGLSEGTISVADSPEDATVFVDDIIDSGKTADRWQELWPGRSFYALIDKRNPHSMTNSPEAVAVIQEKSWIVFPFEADDRASDDSIVGTIRNRIAAVGAPYYANDNISQYIEVGELETLQGVVQERYHHFLRSLIIDIDNDHNTQDTAKRVAKMFIHETFAGRYKPAPKITDFPNAKHLDELYMTGPITVRSVCSHHIAPIIGKCWIGVIPGERVIGLSKFNRIVEWFASRGQIQEELVVQIADYLETRMKPKGLAVIIEATHTCMTSRGVHEPMDAKMTTSVVRGALKDKPEARAEFLALVTKSQ